jgi:hypothetical protein
MLSGAVRSGPASGLDKERINGLGGIRLEKAHSRLQLG